MESESREDSCFQDVAQGRNTCGQCKSCCDASFSAVLLLTREKSDAWAQVAELEAGIRGLFTASDDTCGPQWRDNALVCDANSDGLNYAWVTLARLVGEMPDQSGEGEDDPT